MKMIDVLSLMAKGEIKEGTKLKMGCKIYDYINDYTGSDDCSFVNQEDVGDIFLEDNELITKSFLNYDVELIEPKPKEYLVKLNVQGLYEGFAYLNYFVRRNQVRIHDEFDNEVYKTHFTKDELQSIQPVKEFLEDMEGKYELIEVEDNEID